MLEHWVAMLGATVQATLECLQNLQCDNVICTKPNTWEQSKCAKWLKDLYALVEDDMDTVTYTWLDTLADVVSARLEKYQISHSELAEVAECSVADVERFFDVDNTLPLYTIARIVHGVDINISKYLLLVEPEDE